METEKIKYLINAYLDNESTLENDKIMFAAIAQSEELSNYFKNCMRAKKVMKLVEEDYPVSLDKIILKSFLPKQTVEKKNTRGIITSLSLGFAIIIFFFAFILIKENTRFKTEISQALNKINEQDKRIELIINSFPTVEIKPTYFKEVIIKSN